jgi:1-pyrroline-5-carboxylate dehydrogenase
MRNALSRPPLAVNEKVLDYAPGSPEKSALKQELARLSQQQLEIPLVIGGQEVTTGVFGEVVVPHDHRQVLARYHQAGPEEVRQAIAAALVAAPVWQAYPWEERCAIFLRAAELLATRYRFRLNAGAMLAGGKNVFQAEIDAACELIDFLRFNVHFAREIYQEQPQSSPGVWNTLQYRPLEGFVLAISPFNFTAIAGNLATAPAIMGNTVLWKPASTLVYTPYLFLQILTEAGLPPGVINFVPGAGASVGEVCLASRHLAGVHFTGSTRVFQQICQTVGNNIKNYATYPRLVGETGGKDFVVAHASAEVAAVVTALVRGAFEYQGQKCSAASRAYLPRSLWPAIEAGLRQQIGRIRIGSPVDFRNFMGAVIDRSAFQTISGYIDAAQKSDRAKIIIGGGCDDQVGFFIEPTVILTTDPHYKTMVEEIFGPVLTVYVYDDAAYSETLALCDTSSVYALTGSIFARDRRAVVEAVDALQNSAGNFYINDKPTGAVVGQQPFGGARASGTNDKAGSPANLLRWVSPRTLKETFVPPTDFAYPFMAEE